MSYPDIVLQALSEARVLSHSHLRDLKVPSSVIARMSLRGQIVRCESLSGATVGYALPDQVPVNTVEREAAAIGARHPGSVLCASSALRLHDLWDDRDSEWYAAVGPGRNRVTKMDNVRLALWTDPDMFIVGVEQRGSGALAFRVTDPSRTVLDTMRMVRWNKCHESDTLEGMRRLVDRQGIEALDRMADYALRLRMHASIGERIRAVRELLRCRTEQSIGPR